MTFMFYVYFRLNSFVKYVPYHLQLDSSNAMQIIQQYPSGSIFNEVTVELQWLEHLWNHDNMLETALVGANECHSLRLVRRHNRDISFLFSLI